MKLQRLLKKYADGVTFTGRGLDYVPVYYKTGYFVALTDNEVLPDQANINQLHDLAKTLNLSRFYYGWWLDQKTGKGYLDVSVHVGSKTEAVALAKVFRQKAVWDCAASDSLYIN